MHEQHPLFLKHGIVVFCFFRDILDHIPVFHDFALFDPENIHGRLATVLGVQFDVVMDEYQVPICPMCLISAVLSGNSFRNPVTPSLKASFPSLKPGLC